MHTPSEVETTAATQFVSKTAASLVDGSFVRLALSAPAKDGDSPRKIFGRLVRIKGVSQLSLTLRFPTRDVTKNLSLPEVSGWLEGELKN